MYKKLFSKNRSKSVRQIEWKNSCCVIAMDCDADTCSQSFWTVFRETWTENKKVSLRLKLKVKSDFFLFFVLLLILFLVSAIKKETVSSTKQRTSNIVSSSTCNTNGCFCFFIKPESVHQFVHIKLGSKSPMSRNRSTTNEIDSIEQWQENIRLSCKSGMSINFWSSFNRLTTSWFGRKQH